MQGIHLGARMLVPLIFVVGAASAGPIDVGTSASETATYGSVTQSGGPFPWSDFGITASATVTPGTLNVQTGGSTAFNLTTSFTAGQVLTAGDPFNLSYNPNWSGSKFYSTPAASGSFNSQFVYNIGPFSGNDTILNVPLSVPGRTTGNLTASLNNTVFSPPVVAGATIGGPGVSATATLAAQGCFIVCVTVASASLSFNVGTQIQQSIVAAPLVTYGDVIWESTTPTYSASDHPVFVGGALGSVMNTLAAPSGLTAGETFYYNVLPAVLLNMLLTDGADVAVPASITASYDIFGAGGSQTWPLGDLYELGGAGSFGFDPTFYGGEFYSLPLTYEPAHCAQIACFPATYTVLGSGGGNPVNTPTGGVPGDSGPCGGSLITCGLNLTPTGTNGGYGDTPTDPLFPDCGPIGTTYANYCIGTVPPTVTYNQSVPEPDALLLTGGGLLGLLLSRRKLARPWTH